MIIRRLSLLALSLLALAPAARAGNIEETKYESAFSSGFEMFYRGPVWFRNAMANPAASRLQSYASSGDRVTKEADFVGTLTDTFNSDMAAWSSPLYRTSSKSLAGPLAPNVVNAVITWDGAGAANAWLTGTNWSTDTVPTSADTATFATTAGATAITINFGGATNNGAANQIVGAIALTGGESKSIASSTATAGTLTINAVGGVLLSNSSIFDLTLQNGGTSAMTVALPNSGSIDVTSTGNIIISSSVTGAAAVTKTGAGTLILSGNNTYGGGTNVNGGTLLANSPTGQSSTGSGAVIVNSTGTLGGSGFINTGVNGVTVNSGGTITGGTNGTVGTLTLTTASLAMSGTYLVDLTAATSDLLAIIGTLDLTSLTDTITFQGTAGAASYTLATYTGLVTPLDTFDTVNGLPAGYSLVYGPTSLNLVAIPEPGTWIGAALALAAIGFTQRRKLRGLLARA